MRESFKNYFKNALKMPFQITNLNVSISEVIILLVFGLFLYL